MSRKRQAVLVLQLGFIVCLLRKQLPILSRWPDSWKFLAKVAQHYDPVAYLIIS
jgi:hypothetical protein